MSNQVEDVVPIFDIAAVIIKEVEETFIFIASQFAKWDQKACFIGPIVIFSDWFFLEFCGFDDRHSFLAGPSRGLFELRPLLTPSPDYSSHIPMFEDHLLMVTLDLFASPTCQFLWNQLENSLFLPPLGIFHHSLIFFEHFDIHIVLFRSPKWFLYDRIVTFRDLSS